MVDWESTDQFGNLYVGHSDASTLEELAPDLADLIERLQERADAVVVTIDIEYSQLNGPKPDQVSHVLNAPLVAALVDGGRTPAEVVDLISEVIGMDALVVLADS